MVITCDECRKAFEPPFDPNEYLLWINACIEANNCWLCFDCAGVSILEDVPDYISIVVEDE